MEDKLNQIHQDIGEIKGLLIAHQQDSARERKQLDKRVGRIEKIGMMIAGMGIPGSGAAGAFLQNFFSHNH